MGPHSSPVGAGAFMLSRYPRIMILLLGLAVAWSLYALYRALEYRPSGELAPTDIRRLYVK